MSQCLNQASQVVQELASNSGGNVAAVVNDDEASTSTNAIMSTVGQAVSSSSDDEPVHRQRILLAFKQSRATSSSVTAPAKSKKAKVESSKVFEFVLVRFDDEGEDDYSDNALSDSLMLTDERTVLRGFVTLSSNDNEQAIRRALSDAIQMKYPAVAIEDLVFLKANWRRLTKPVNCHEYSFKQVKSQASQGAIYVKLKNCLSFLLNSQGSDSSSLNDEEFRNRALTRPTSTLKTTTAVAECISICNENNVCNPVEVLKCAQKLILHGRPLDVLSTEEALTLFSVLQQKNSTIFKT